MHLKGYSFLLLAAAFFALPLTANAQSQTLMRDDGSTEPGDPVESEHTGTIVDRGGDEITLTQSELTEKVESGAVACALTDFGYTTTNSWWRMFDLSEVAEIEDGFMVTSAGVGIGTPSYDNFPTVTGELRFYTVEGDLSVNNITLVGSSEIELTEDLALSVVDVDVSDVNVPADAQLAVELYIPECFDPEEEEPTAGCDIRAGINSFGETGPTYLYAYDYCVTIPDITPVADIGFPDSYWVLTVTGVNATLASEEGTIPEGFELDLFPNPVASTATLNVQLDTAENITVTVYDVTGREVATLHEGAVNGQLALEFDSSEFTNGVYVVQLRGESFSTTHKFVVID